MSKFPITENLESAIQQAKGSRPDGLGSIRHTFRVQIAAEDVNGHEILTQLVNQGWQLRAAPVVIDATKGAPRHVLLSMLRAEPRTLRIHGELNNRGSAEFRGEIVPEH